MSVDGCRIDLSNGFASCFILARRRSFYHSSHMRIQTHRRCANRLKFEFTIPYHTIHTVYLQQVFRVAMMIKAMLVVAFVLLVVVLVLVLALSMLTDNNNYNTYTMEM